MKKTILFSGLALTAFAFADGELIVASQPMKGQPQQQQMMNPNMVTLTSARPESDNGWYLFADVLYWHADVGDTDWAIKVPQDGATLPRSATMHSLDFKWNWGFKVGLGVNMDHDMWDSNFYYTWFQTENSNRAGVNPATGFVVDNMGGFEDYTTGKINWDIHYSMFDWELGRFYYVSKNLAMRPHVGLKGGWINQDIHLHLKNENAFGLASFKSSDKFENDFWGIGPSFGVNTLWVLGSAGKAMDHRFSLYGDAAGALMYGHFEVKHREVQTTRTNVVSGGLIIHDLTRNLAAAMLQGAMGLSWDTAFNQGRNHFMMKVGYEFQYWFRQNQLSWNDTTAPTFARRLSDDLALQGVVGELRFDF
jgi:hypothetical protein